MTWQIPAWWELALLALAAWRTFQLVSADVILDRPREALIRRLGDKFDEWVTCPFCAGAWISVAWWLAWIAWPKWALIVATPVAISAVLALVAVNLGPDD